MDIVERSISELIPAEYNPRQLTEKQFNDLQASFKNLGTLEPAVINVNPERRDVIISGHQRLRVAEALGMSTYPCYEVNFPIDKEREANIRMNRNTGDWDWDKLANEFEVEDLKAWGFDDKNFPDLSDTDFSEPKSNDNGDFVEFYVKVYSDKAADFKNLLNHNKTLYEKVSTNRDVDVL